MRVRRGKVIIDEAVFSKIADGDNEALTGLYELTYKPVFALLLSCTQNYHDAEDLLQETYIKICQGARLYKPGGNPMAWIMTIAKNLYISKYRKDSRIITDSFQEEVEQIPYEYISETEDRLLIEKLIRTLKEEERNTIILHVMQGFTFREISEILDKPSGTVLSLYHRGIKKLRKALGD